MKEIHFSANHLFSSGPLQRYSILTITCFLLATTLIPWAVFLANLQPNLAD
jgi:hypothetical protein